MGTRTNHQNLNSKRTVAAQRNASSHNYVMKQYLAQKGGPSDRQLRLMAKLHRLFNDPKYWEVGRRSCFLQGLYEKGKRRKLSAKQLDAGFYTLYSFVPEMAKKGS